MNLSFTSKFLANVKFLKEKRTRYMQNYLNELDSPDTVPLTPSKGVYGHLTTKPSRQQRNRHQEVDSLPAISPPRSLIATKK